MTTDDKNCIDKPGHWSAKVDQVVTDSLSGKDWESLRGHLKACGHCRGQYNFAMRAVRMLAGGPDAAFTPAPAELERIGSAVLDLASAETKPKSLLGRLGAWLSTPSGAGLTIALGAAVAVVVILPSLSPTKPEFQSRGGKDIDLFSSSGTNHPLPTRQAGLRAFCVAGSSLSALDGATDARCGKDAQLKLTVSNRGKFARLFLVGVDGKRDLKWYAPHPPDSGSITAPTETGETPVGSAIRIGVNHEPGPVRIYALFSDLPVTAADVEAAVAKIPAGPLPESLPLARQDVLQRGLSFVVE